MCTCVAYGLHSTQPYAEDAAKRAELEGAVGSTLTEVTGSSGNVALATYFQSGDAEAAAAREEAEAGAGGKKPLGRSISLLSGAVENKGNFQVRVFFCHVGE